MNIKDVKTGTLAYLGDCVYELEIRKHLISLGINDSSKLQKKAINYVSALNQCQILKKLIDENFFTDEEMAFIKHARNHKPNSKPKHVDIVTYKYATALEAYFGKMYLENNLKRIKLIMERILGDKNAGIW